jgi:hypothetical protein
MDIGSIFLILAILLLVGVYIARPFFDHKSTSVGSEERMYSSLLAERDRILAALQELDADHAMGKIPEEDYPSQRASLLKRGADILRAMETQQGRKDSGRDHSKLKAAVASASTGAPGAAAANGKGSAPAAAGGGDADDELEVLIASRRRTRPEKAAGFCPQCGGTLQKSDSFCPKCGAGVKN